MTSPSLERIESSPSLERIESSPSLERIESSHSLSSEKKQLSSAKKEFYSFVKHFSKNEKVISKRVLSNLFPNKFSGEKRISFLHPLTKEIFFIDVFVIECPLFILDGSLIYYFSSDFIGNPEEYLTISNIYITSSFEEMKSKILFFIKEKILQDDTLNFCKENNILALHEKIKSDIPLTSREILKVCGYDELVSNEENYTICADFSVWWTGYKKLEGQYQCRVYSPIFFIDIFIGYSKFLKKSITPKREYSPVNYGEVKGEILIILYVRDILYNIRNIPLSSHFLGELSFFANYGEREHSLPLAPLSKEREHSIRLCEREKPFYFALLVLNEIVLQNTLLLSRKEKFFISDSSLPLRRK